MAAQVETVWFRHRFNGSIHETAKGSPSYMQCLREQTQVDVESGEIPEPVFERLSDAEVKKVTSKPEQLPGYVDPKRTRLRGRKDQQTVVVQSGPAAGPSEEEIQAQIDAAVQAGIASALEQLSAKSDDQPDGDGADKGDPKKEK